MKPYQQLYQGDIWLMRLPDDMAITSEPEIPRPNGKLILQEGEMTGHHHYVDAVMDRPPSDIFGGKFIGKEDFVDEDGEVSFDALNSVLGGSLAEKREAPVAKFYAASKLAEQLVRSNVLQRADLVVGLLDVEGGQMNVFHQEHGALALSPGKYVVGRQIESVAGEERRVAD